MPVMSIKKKLAYERYTASDSSAAKEVVVKRKADMAQGKKLIKGIEEGVMDYKKHLEENSGMRARYNNADKMAKSDTTLSTALKDVKAEQRTPAPRNVDVLMVIKKRKK